MVEGRRSGRSSPRASGWVLERFREPVDRPRKPDAVEARTGTTIKVLPLADVGATSERCSTSCRHAYAHYPIVSSTVMFAVPTSSGDQDDAFAGKRGNIAFHIRWHWGMSARCRLCRDLPDRTQRRKAINNPVCLPGLRNESCRAFAAHKVTSPSTLQRAQIPEKRGP